MTQSIGSVAGMGDAPQLESICGPYRSGRTGRLIARALEWAADGPVMIVAANDAAAQQLERRILSLPGPPVPTLQVVSAMPLVLASAVLVDDAPGPPAMFTGELAEAIASGRQRALVVTLGTNSAESGYEIPPPAQHVRVGVHHPTLEGEAILGELLSTGRPWRELAVVAPRTVLRTVVRAAQRHGVPVSGRLDRAGSPVRIGVQALLELTSTGILRTHTVAAVLAAGWATTNTAQAERTHTPSRGATGGLLTHPALEPLRRQLLELATADDIWEWVAPHVVRDAAATTDALLALGYVATEPPALDAVSLLTPTEILGRRWPVVVLGSCIDGAWSGDTFALARSRADDAVIGMCAPAPGELVSRFVEGWPLRPPQYAPLPGAASSRPPNRETPAAGPLWPDVGLRLSATQVDTYRNCPLQHAIEYALRVRREGGVQARFGSFVHTVMERFLDPTARHERTFERLTALVDELWDDGVFDYRPQAVDYRRRLDGWLEQWWDDEGRDLGEVVAVEHRFDIPVGQHRVVGVIDRVSRRSDNTLEIVDYKTGRKPEASGSASVQLATYLLAARRDPTLQQHGDVTRLRLHYLAAESNREVEIPVTAGTEGDIERVLTDVAERIRSGAAEPNPNADCEYCDARRLCPLQPEGRQLAPVAPPPPVGRRRREKHR